MTSSQLSRPSEAQARREPARLRHRPPRSRWPRRGHRSGPGLRGAKDPAVLAGATADGRLLLTLDRGLGDIRAYPPGTHAGLIVIRLDPQSPRAIRHAVERIGATLDLDNLQGCIAVWRDGELRSGEPDTRRLRDQHKYRSDARWPVFQTVSAEHGWWADLDGYRDTLLEALEEVLSIFG